MIKDLCFEIIETCPNNIVFFVHPVLQLIKEK